MRKPTSSKNVKKGPQSKEFLSKESSEMHGYVCVVVQEGKTYLCKIDPNTGACNLNDCIPAGGRRGSVRDLATVVSVGNADNELMKATASMPDPSGSTPLPPAVRQACLAVAYRTGQFRRQNQSLINQLSALDLDRTASTYPKEVASAMIAAEQARMLLIKSFADFDIKCTSLETAAGKASGV